MTSAVVRIKRDRGGKALEVGASARVETRDPDEVNKGRANEWSIKMPTIKHCHFTLLLSSTRFLDIRYINPWKVDNYGVVSDATFFW